MPRTPNVSLRNGFVYPKYSNQLIEGTSSASDGRKHTSRVRKYSINRLANESLTISQLQQRGFTHPQNGRWLMLPREFKAIVAYESKAVVQVILEVLDRTIGVEGDGPYGRGLWAEMSTWECAATGLMSHSAAQRGLTQAVHKSYLRQKVLKVDKHGNAISFAYSLNWHGIIE
jgi:hypothetical protein